MKYVTILEGRASQLFLDFSQSRAWRFDSFWALKGSSALVQCMLELVIHCRISCSFIWSIWPLSSKTLYLTVKSSNSRGSSASLVQTWKMPNSIKFLFEHVWAELCSMPNVGGFTPEERQAPSWTLLLTISPPSTLQLLSLVQCQILKHRETSTSQASGYGREMDCKEPLRVFSDLIFKNMYYSAEIF